MTGEIRQDDAGHGYPVVPAPVPYGARVVDGGVQFTVFSRHAARVWLMLFDDPDADAPAREYALDPAAHRLGDVWHLFVPEARAGQFYAYRMDNPGPEPQARCFRADQWLLDPYALAVSGSPRWGDPWGLPAGTLPTAGAKFPKGVIVADDFDWGNDRSPGITLQDAVIYEAHLRGFTAREGSGVSAPGTYEGFTEKIPHLVELGVTSVEFLPLFEFNEMEYYRAGDRRKDLRNYWGYSTVAFFAPNARYAAGPPGRQVCEFKTLVKALHQAGLEVILDVVYNHTAENGAGGPVYSFRGIDCPVYYLIEDDGDRYRYRDYSGCGNTVHANHPVVRRFIIDSLRYWVQEMHVDGFRFDLATALTRGPDGEILPHPPLIEEISNDPVLRGVKLIAEAWDAAGGYQVGAFPGGSWAEWNGRYRDDVRRFWKGDDGMLGALAERLSGSSDLYNHHGQTPQKSINFVTSHDGFTLLDLVSYRHRHNEANQEDNRDGEKHNHSVHCGVEGPSDDPAIRRLRKRCIKNFIATLMLSQGVPMLPAGDEFGRTQQGNNNAYCQDNELAWLDWSLAEQNADLLDFTRRAIAFRRTQPALRRRRFFHGRYDEEGDTDIVWSGPNGQRPDWPHGAAVACWINGDRRITGCAQSGDDVLLIFNGADQAEAFHVPVTDGKPWQIVLTTQEHRPSWTVEQRVLHVDARSVNVLTSGRNPADH